MFLRLGPFLVLVSLLLPSTVAVQAQSKAGASTQRPPITTLAELEAITPTSPNPYVSFLPVGVEADYHYWRAAMRLEAERRPQPAWTAALDVAAENETRGATNDTPATAEPWPCGVNTSCVLMGTTDTPASPGAPTAADAEENGTLATATVVNVADAAAVAFTGTIGDGAHGSSGTDSGDFDIFSLSLTAGDSVTVDLNTADPLDDLDPLVGVFHDDLLLAFNDDDPFATTFDSFLQFTAFETGTYYVVIGGFRSPFNGPPNDKLPTDLTDASTGPGSGSEGDYEVVFGRNSGVDYYEIPLEAGQVVGAASDIPVELSILSPTTAGALDEGQGAFFSVAGLLPPSSPLPTTATGSEVSNVARESGTHYLRVRSLGGSAAYEVQVGIFEPPSSTLSPPQNLFLDFDGVTGLDAEDLFGSPASSNADLSPLADFLAGWGLAPTDEDALIDAIIASMEETLADLSAVNPSMDVNILNSRDDAGPLPPNTSTVIIGGTIAELGISTIGIASVIDTGNFGLDDTAVVLLDLLSDVPGPNSLNQFGFTPATTAGKIALVAEGLANIAIHEAGHFWGNFHTEQWNDVASIQDQGGNLANSVGVGPDGDFGTGDDVDVDFLFDVYSFVEGFWGIEDQAGRTAFGLDSPALIFADGFESGDVTAW